MSARIALESSTLDTLDAQITRALQISPRVAFAELAEILDVAEQTVARRYRRMRRDGYLRVTMTADLHGTGGANWLVRVRCRPEGADTIARAIAARDDVSWVSIYGAGWEVDFNLRAPADVETHELLHEMLPRSAPVLDVAPAEILHTYIGGAGEHQDTWSDVLTSAQTAALRATAPPVVSSKGVRAELDDIDRLLIDELGRDGRVAYSTLARTAGSTPGKVTRRVERLIGSGVAYFHVDLATAAIGLRSTALWLTVVPRSLASVGRALGTDPRIPFAAAVTGRANLTANVIGAGPDDLYSFVTEDLARLDGITGYELVPLLRRVKHAGALVHGDKLAPPQISPNRRRASSRSAL
ncbi:putative AsnC family transcriptional regulator [Gordonia polyisoprenivorans NBRC 16320 = JCM 10675]|uniref:Lrp/AsnC family transcriptional regulator n=1 Tax=Gordonia polyisoprenivorans TaxID=84595 RepID=A0A846WPJ9_9ACTN|nr:AsnC family transcriptional regulator [Gordonia polyisoprenivorans]MBE7192614.1 Lrp/AsnC family transcriptional regulator [Gordonia polyisoprenivorans]NKY03167.1 Lrp/AsnC family transcriptional regulator [Gordonia polyisoprenivorans]OZC31905.1 Lrp/AsnC family transcriptional regulator [Gordonia polyisoprenivorans]QUD83753.1 Lrp/AsnC family transcriptional regulator [Gordonia polyisoprenivorans]UZF55272.1 Lrp/AsnC family transcriptional regulator [Gordonia polyisoprenivorans]